MAGAFQFTSLKYRCLEKCRSPFMFVTEHWSGRNDRSDAFGLGLRHGLNVRWGRRLSAPLGFALLAWGVAIVGFQIL